MLIPFFLMVYALLWQPLDLTCAVSIPWCTGRAVVSSWLCKRWHWPTRRWHLAGVGFTTPSRWENRTEAYHQAWDDQLAKGFRTPSPSWDGEWFLEVSLWVVSADTLCRYAYVSGAQTCSACVVPGKLVANKYGVWSSPRYWLVTIARTNHQPMESIVYEHCPCEITKQLPVERAEAWKRVLPTGGLKGFIST